MTTTATGHDVPVSAAGPPRWVRLPQQARARQTIERALDAAAGLLAEQGFEGFSISEVCRRAAVSPGALYDRVDGKEGLFLAVHERELARISGALTRFADGPAWRALPTAQLVETAVRQLGEHYLREAPLLKVFILRAAVDPQVRAEGSEAAAAVTRAVGALLLTRAADYPHPDPGAAVRAAVRTTVDAMGWRVAFGMDFADERPEPLEDWLDRLSAMARTYLLGPAA
ncbi:TetR/AcrR family transcriptional regulator [Blastococcus sp. SYSU D00820]